MNKCRENAQMPKQTDKVTIMLMLMQTNFNEPNTMKMLLLHAAAFCVCAMPRSWVVDFYQ